MSFYQEHLLPHLINCACGMKAIDRQRQKVVPLAHGHVLEIGMGSGLNLKHYNADEVACVWGLEPSLGMRKKAQDNVAASSIHVEWLSVISEQIPLETDSMDTVVLTYTLCTIEDTQAALAEMLRVLKPQGKLLFSEHGVSPEVAVQEWQRRINPIWKRLAGGCNLNRDIIDLIQGAGFTLEQSEQAYVKGPKVATYQYWGVASPV